MAFGDFSDPVQQPLTFADTPESLKTRIQDAVTRTESVINRITSTVTPATATWTNVLEPFLLDDNEAAMVRSHVGFYKDVSPDEAIQKASIEATEIDNAAHVRKFMREDLFALVNAVYQKREDMDLDREQRHLLSKLRAEFKRNGLEVPAGPQRDRVREISDRVQQLAMQAGNNLAGRKAFVGIYPQDLAGVSPDDVDTTQLEEGTGDDAGKLMLPLIGMYVGPVLQHAHDGETRRAVYLAETNKVNENVPILKEVLVLNDEKARILGYPNHAAFELDEFLPKTVGRLREFLTDLRERLTVLGKIELQELLKLKERDCQKRSVPFDGDIFDWDYSYYAHKITKQQVNFDSTAVKQYFSTDKTFDGMLRIFENIFGFVFNELTAEDRDRISPTGRGHDLLWHETVGMYAVFDDQELGGEFRGYLYRDLYPRQFKFSHHASFMLGPSFRLPGTGGTHCISSALVCNYDPPTSTRPGLLSHDLVWNMFHELGHCIHDLAAKTRYAYKCGASTDDFNEAPSQMLENWTWETSVLVPLSSHWQTGEQIPLDLAESVVRSRQVLPGMFYLRQLAIATADLALQTPATHEHAKETEVGQLFNQLWSEISMLKSPVAQGLGWDWGNKVAVIPHFFSGFGAYYMYMYTQVFSTDMYYTFFKDDPMNEREGRRYRRMIIEQGGARPPMEFLTEYLGRDASPDAFFKLLGLES